MIAKNEKGDRITINAKAVVISTGGFSCNPEIVKKYLPYAGYESAGSPGRTGDGIQMLQKAGAELVNMNVTMQAGLWLKDVPTGLQFGKDGLTGAKYVRLLAALFQPYLSAFREHSLDGRKPEDDLKAYHSKPRKNRKFRLRD